MTIQRHVQRQAVDQPAAPPWWRRAVLYENHMASFRDGNGDGVGDLPGLIASLDYLAGLGIGAIWLSPCFTSPMLDQGFDISDYTDIEPLFGTLDDFDELIEQAHARGIRIIADYVPNHTSDQHPWFVESRSSRTSPKRDWYVWRDGKPDGLPPNNWTSEAGGSVWQRDAATGQYFLHSHLVQQPDLNWRNDELCAAMLDVLRFWLDRGVDGFRIDVAHLLMKDPEFRDNPVLDVAAHNEFDVQHADFATQLHVHDRMHPDVHLALRRIRATVDEYPDAALIGEIEAMDWSQWAEYFGADLDEIQLPFAFRLIETPWQAARLATELSALYAAVPAGAWPVLALGNHDRPRLASRISAPQLRVAAMMLLTLRGTPMIFYGDELGLPNQDVPSERYRDHFGLSQGGASRDPIRTPMPWNSEANAGFSSADPDRLWLPVSVHADELNVQAQLARDDSLLRLYRSLIAQRRTSAALLLGDIRLGWAGSPAVDGCLAYERLAAGDRKVVLLNLTGQPLRVPAPEPAIVMMSTHRHPRSATDTIDLAADEGVVLHVSAEAGS
ncbi:MAG: alpha-amylase family glycosyl hydrolase [Pseudonocardiales bacterium]